MLSVDQGHSLPGWVKARGKRAAIAQRPWRAASLMTLALMLGSSLSQRAALAQTPLGQAPFAQQTLAQAGVTPAPGGAAPVVIAPPSLRRPDLEIGRSGAVVAELQAVLKLLGFYLGEVHGQYDEATSVAVVRFQAAAQLPQTGRMDQRTWDAIFPLDRARNGSPVAQAPSAPAPPKPAPSPAQPTPPPSAPAKQPPAPATPAKPNPYPTLKLGEKGDAVIRLQRQLKKKGFLDGEPDGAFGPMTEAAVKAAQEKLGLEVDGIVGPATWQALLK